MHDDNYQHAEITEKIIKQVYYIFNKLGYGFLEKVYENAMIKKLKDIGLKVEQQKPINVIFENEIIGKYFADIIVEEKIIIELKSIETFNSIHEIQLVNYLKATNMEVGLLINFGKKLEIKRKVNLRKS